MSKEIPLTQGMVALVSDEDFKWINEYKWYAKKSNRSSRYYAARSVWVVNEVTGKKYNKTIWMHRFIVNAPVGMETHHKDCTPLNNIRENLLVCTKDENLAFRQREK